MMPNPGVGTTGGIRWDSRLGSGGSDGILGAVMRVLAWRPGKVFRISSWPRGTSGAPDCWLPDCAQSLRPWEGEDARLSVRSHRSV